MTLLPRSYEDWRKLWRRNQRPLRRLLTIVFPLAISAALFVALSLVAWTLLVSFGTDLSDMGTIAQRHAVLRGGPLTGKLFREFAAHGLIEARQGQDGAPFDLRVAVDCDAVLGGFPPREESAAGPAASSKTRRETLLRQLCHSDPGLEILKEVKQWRRKMLTLAIRDTSRDDRYFDRKNRIDLCANGEDPNGFYLPSGCRPGGWTASFGAESASASAPVLPEAPSADIYGFLAFHPPRQQSGKAVFGDWTRFDAADWRGEVTTLRKRVTPAQAPGEIVVEVVGDVEAGELRPVEAGPVLAAAQLAPLCPPQIAGRGCDEISAKNYKPFAYRLRFAYVAPGAFDLIVKARPIAAYEERALELGNPQKVRFCRGLCEDEKRDPRDVTQVVRLTDHIVARCDEAPSEDDAGVVVAHVSEETACRLDWLSAESANASKGEAYGTVSVKLLDQAGEPKELVEPRPRSLAAKTARPETQDEEEEDEDASAAARPALRPTREALDLGLAALVGVDEKDRFSLIGQLQPFTTAGVEAAPTPLTLSYELQKAAMGQIRRLTDPADASFREVKALFKGAEALRRAAIVLVDAGPVDAKPDDPLDAETGAVLAAASWPLPRPGLSEWDLHALESWRPTLSPLAARAWTQNDRHNAPGSTFKTVVALAAIDQAARGDENIRRMLGTQDDGAKKTEMGEIFGTAYDFRWDSAGLDPYAGNPPRDGKRRPIQSHGATVCQHIRKGCLNPESRLSMRDMMAQSNNMYFARLALALDENNVSRVAGGERRVEYGPRDAPCESAPLPETADDDDGGDGQDRQPSCRRRLAIARMACRLWPTQARNLFEGVAQTLSNAVVSSNSRLYATPIQLDEANLKQARLRAVAANGIGQQAQATPLAMATIMAEIATGRIVLPRLLLGADRSAPVRGEDPCDRYRAGGGKTPAHGEPIFDPEDKLALRDATEARGPDRDKAEAMLGVLRLALEDVVRRGTAADAFSRPEYADIRDRLHAKTGTAQIEDNYDTVWFAGWLDGLRNFEKFKDRRIAFACMITHVTPKGAAGGATCAPVMRDLFLALEKSAAPAAEAEPQATAPAAPQQAAPPPRRRQPAVRPTGGRAPRPANRREGGR